LSDARSRPVRREMNAARKNIPPVTDSGEEKRGWRRSEWREICLAGPSAAPWEAKCCGGASDPHTSPTPNVQKSLANAYRKERGSQAGRTCRRPPAPPCGTVAASSPRSRTRARQTVAGTRCTRRSEQRWWRAKKPNRKMEGQPKRHCVSHSPSTNRPVHASLGSREPGLGRRCSAAAAGRRRPGTTNGVQRVAGRRTLTDGYVFRRTRNRNR